MKARLTFWCVCAVTMVVVPTAAFAEILNDGYWWGGSQGDGASSPGWWTYSSPTASANGDPNNSECIGVGEGWYSVWTNQTENELTGYAYIYGWAEANVDPACESGDWAEAGVYASGHVHGSTRYLSLSYSAGATPENPEDSDGGSDYDSRTGKFTTNTGVSCSHQAAALATVYSGRGIAFSHACSRAYGNLYR